MNLFFIFQMSNNNLEKLRNLTHIDSKYQQWY